MAGVALYLVYLATNPFPAPCAGHYLAMAQEVSGHGYALPCRIPHYTREGIPFAYPPLAIYALALIRDATGIGPLVLNRWLPGALVASLERSDRFERVFGNGDVVVFRTVGSADGSISERHHRW